MNFQRFKCGVQKKLSAQFYPRFHDRIKLLGDKQYYYEPNAIGMDKKGAKLRKIWILQDQYIYFHTYIHFLYLFRISLVTLDRRHIYERIQGLGATNLNSIVVQSKQTGMTGWFQ